VRSLRTAKIIPHQRNNEIPQAANRVLRYVPNRVRAADRVVGAERNSRGSYFGSRGGSATEYKIVAENVGPRDKRTIELGANIAGAGAAIEVNVIRRTNAVVCELKPLFSLPSGRIYPLTMVRGTKLENDLTKSLDAAKAARASLFNLQTTLSGLQSDLRSAQSAICGNGNTAGETAAGRTQALAAASSLRSQITSTNRKIAAAERLSNQEQEIQVDLSAIHQIGSYAKTIVSVAKVSVRIHCGDTTIPATVK
jgi:hypothetical protein